MYFINPESELQIDSLVYFDVLISAFITNLNKSADEWEYLKYVQDVLFL